MGVEVLLVEDSPGDVRLTQEAFREADSRIRLHVASDGLEAMEFLRREGNFRDAPRPDFILLDLNLPGAYGFSALAHLRGSHPEMPVIVISATDDSRTVHLALAFGAQGFVSKSADAASIGRTIQAVLRGDLVTPAEAGIGDVDIDVRTMDVARRMAQLTPQQFRVFGMLCSGRLNKQIARDMQITEATVKAHMTAIMRKLGAANRTQAVLLAGRLARDPSEITALPEGVE